MSTYKVIASKDGFVKGVHHNIRAASAKAACEIARKFYPPRTTRLKLEAVEV